MGLGSRVANGFKWVLLEKTGVQITSFLVFLYLARVLGPELFGLVALSKIFIDFASIFVKQGFAQALIQRENLEAEHLDTAFWFNLFTCVFVSAIFFLFSGLMAEAFNEPQLAPILYWLTIVFCSTGLVGVQQAIFRKEFKFKQLAVRTLIASSVGNVVAIVMAIYGYGVWALVGREIVISIASVFLIWFISDWRPRFRFSPRHFKELFSYGIHVLWGNMLEYWGKRTDSFLIGYFLSTASLGIYNVAQRMMSIISDLVSQTLGRVTLPLFSKLQSDQVNLEKSFFSITKVTTLVSFPLYLGLSMTSQDLVPVVFGDKWLLCIPVMQIISISGLSFSVIYPINSLLLGVGKPGLSNLLVLITSLLKIISVVLVIDMGISMTAAAITVSSFIALPFWIFSFVKKVELRAKGYMMACTPAILSSLIMCVFIFFSKQILVAYTDVNNFISLTICIGVGVIAYLLSVYFIFPGVISELKNYRKNA